MDISHINESGYAKMVDVSEKTETYRKAIARAKIVMKKETLERIIAGGIKKGDVLQVAQVAGIMAAKNTSTIIPMCHPLLLTGIDISFQTKLETFELVITSEVSLFGKTGVEMEALTSVSIAALTVYDMCKSIDKEMVIKEIKLLEKTGGKSGTFRSVNDER